ncbi:COG1835 Predicted acyltransferases [Candidatus Nanopelagicaceae bacterium]
MSPKKRGITHIPAIDGLRAVAVIAVMLYHLGFSWIPGGFLGVDLFFVISGYVITRLLLDSIQRSGGLDLRAFYKARVRRLLPPLLFMIFGTAIFVGVWAPETSRRLVSDAPFSIFGGMNWWLVFRHTDYFEAIGRPPLLQHTWSLAVEAQFYLIWPLVLLLILKQFGKKRIPGAALFIAAVSGITLFIVSLSLDASSASQVSHVYFGTDTHSIGLFLGASLAVSWIPQNLKSEVSQRAQDFVDGIGVIGFIGILGAFLLINENDATLYRIAFPLAGLFGCAILTSIVHPASRFAPLLRTRVLVWIGERSYAIYLWHWIVFQLTRPSVDLAGQDWALYSVRFLIVLALADISLRWVELPVRTGAVESWFRGMKYRTKKVRIRQKISVAVGIIALLAATTAISANAISVASKEAAILEKQLTQEVKPLNPKPTVVSNVAQPDLWVTGDSVILGIRYELGDQRNISLINARVGRQAAELLDVIKHDKLAVGDIPIIFNLGNNNSLGRSQVADIFTEIQNQSQIVVVNTAVPRPWRDSNNALIAEFATQNPKVRIVDWAAISNGHPEYFAPDGVHLQPAGIRVYVAAILEALKI